MNNNSKVIMLTPQYMKKFKCIGGNCEETCCSGWGVTIDKKTYKKYKNCKHIDLKKELNSNIKRNKKNPSEYNYAKIKLNDDATCPFLDDKKLCKIHSMVGESYLSNTCFNYPRIYNFIDSSFENCGTLSCPEIARLALLNPNKMEFDQTEVNINLNNVIGRKINTEKKGIYKYFWDLRVFTINVLQAREYRLWERLVILGIFYESIQNLIENNKIDEIADYINEYIGGIEKGAFDKALSEVPSNEMIQIDILKNILTSGVNSGAVNKSYLECFDEFKMGMEIDGSSDDNGLIKNYLNSYHAYFSPYMKEKEYILENYLVNYVYKNLFPFNSSDNVFNNYILMIVHYALIKMHLIGMMGYHKEKFDDSNIIKLIYSIAKSFEHNNKFITNLIDLFKENEYDTLSHMLLLIKN